MNFIICVVVVVFLLIMAVCAYFDDFAPPGTSLHFCILAAISIGFLIFNISQFFCPDCSAMVSVGSGHCHVCGYELIPHCDACGEICHTAFCKLCGAEQ